MRYQYCNIVCLDLSKLAEAALQNIVECPAPAAASALPTLSTSRRSFVETDHLPSPPSSPAVLKLLHTANDPDFFFFAYNFGSSLLIGVSGTISTQAGYKKIWHLAN